MDEFQKVDESIRALTSVLHALGQGDCPTGRELKGNDIPEFLRHLAALLTTGNIEDKDARCVLAVTGSISENAVNAIIFAQNSQNPPPESAPVDSEMKPTVIERKKGTFGGIMKKGYSRHRDMLLNAQTWKEKKDEGQKNKNNEESRRYDALKRKASAEEVKRLEAQRVSEMEKREKEGREEAARRAYDNAVSNLRAYISELLGLFSEYLEDYQHNLVEFVHWHSMDKLSARLQGQHEIWGGDQESLASVLEAWEVKETDEIAVEYSWIRMPQDCTSILDAKLLARLDQRQVPMSASKGPEILELQFSLQTAPIWTKIIAVLLNEMDKAMAIYMDLREHRFSASRNDKQRKALRELDSKICALHIIVIRNKVTIEALFAIPSLAMTIRNAAILSRNKTASQLNEDEQHSVADFNVAPYERPTDVVLRYLRSLVAWRQAVIKLSQRKYRPLLASMSVHFLSTSGFTSSMMTPDAFNALLGARYPNLKPPSNMYKLLDRFDGAIHAEAALMGLMEYVRDPSKSGLVHTSSDVASLNSLPQKAIINQSPYAVGVSTKCCYCCFELSKILGIRVSGSHGMIFPWICPRVGVTVDDLKKLEDKLWEELYSALHSPSVLHRLQSPHTTPSHSVEGKKEEVMTDDPSRTVDETVETTEVERK